MKELMQQEEMLVGLYERMEEAFREGAIGNKEAEGKYSFTQTDGKSWEEQLRIAEKNGMNVTLQTQTSGEKYKQFGMKELPFAMEKGVIQKGVREPKGSKSGHFIEADLFKKIPEFIQNPVAVIDEKSRNSIVIVTDEMVEARKKEEDHYTYTKGPLVIAVLKNQKNYGRDFHKITSVYGAFNIENLIKKYGVVIFDKEKFSKLEVSRSGLIPDWSTSFENGSRISQEEENVKNRFSFTETDEEYRKEKDIRFSFTDEGLNLQNSESVLRDAMENVKGHRINAIEADRLAGRMIRAIKSSASGQEEIARQIADLYGMLEADFETNYEDFQSGIRQVVKGMLDSSLLLDTAHEDEVADIRKNARARVRLSEDDRRTILGEFDNITQFIRATRGMIISVSDKKKNSAAGTVLTESGQQTVDSSRKKKGNGSTFNSQNSAYNGLEDWYNDMAEEYPWLFDKDMTAADIPMRVVEIAEYVGKRYLNEMDGQSLDMAVEYFAGKLNEEYLALDSVRKDARDAEKLGISAEQYRQYQNAFASENTDAMERAIKGLEGGREKLNHELSQKRRERAAELAQRVMNGEVKPEKLTKEERALLHAMNDREKAMMQDVKNRVRNGMQREREREEMQKARAGISRAAGTLSKWLVSPTQKHHVVEQLVNPTMKLLESLDFGQTKAGLETQRKVGENLKTFAENLQNEFDSGKSGEGEDGFSFQINVDQEMIDRIAKYQR